MEHVSITPRRAELISRSEGLPWPAAPDAYPQLLQTGAKLYRSAAGFFVGGYAANGSDVTPYRRRYTTRTKSPHQAAVA
jgi:hypothetical protein